MYGIYIYYFSCEVCVCVYLCGLSVLLSVSYGELSFHGFDHFFKLSLWALGLFTVFLNYSFNVHEILCDDLLSFLILVVSVLLSLAYNDLSCWPFQKHWLFWFHSRCDFLHHVYSVLEFSLIWKIYDITSLQVPFIFATFYFPLVPY